MDTYIVRVNGKTYEVEVEKKGATSVENILPVKGLEAQKPQSANTGTGEEITCGASGKVWQIVKKEGDSVKKGETMIILEAMKMEIPIVSPFDGTVGQIMVSEGEAVEAGQTVAVVAPEVEKATA